MTWFEAEQICRYLGRLEEALEEWSLNRYQMQSAQTQLSRLNHKLNGEIHGNVQPPQKEVFVDLCNQITEFQRCIDERLKY